MAEPIYFYPGDLSSEPFVKRFASIIREDLKIDLTPLANNKNAIVRATYFTIFDKEAKDFELLFLANQLNGTNFSVTIDKVKVTGILLDSVPLPPNVKTPAFSPSFAPFESLSFNAHSPKGILFKKDLSAGAHEITVEYEVRPALYGSDYSITKIWQFAYLLSPVRNWKSFKDLNITICVPPDWQIATNFSLNRVDDCLTDKLNHLPDDYIILSVKAPHKLAVAINTGICVSIGLVILILTHLLVKVIARKRANNQLHFVISFLVLIVASMISTIILTIVIFSEPDLLRYLLNDQLNWNYGVSRPYFIFAVPVLWFFLLTGTILYYFFYLGRIKKNLLKT